MVAHFLQINLVALLFLKDEATIVAVVVVVLKATDLYVKSVAKLGILPLPVITDLIIIIPVTPGPICKLFWPLLNLSVIQTGTQT